MVKDYKELRVWQQSVELAKLVYVLADMLPAKEQFGLRSQLTRAAVSVASNIAEGSRRKTTKDLLNFLGIAFGSLAEVETQIIIAIEVGLLPANKCKDCFEKINQLAAGIAKLKQTLEKR
jgi:four helix bundle protein